MTSKATARALQRRLARAAEPPLVWLLTGTRVDDRNQLLALAEALGWPFREIRLEYNWLRHLPFLRRGLTTLSPSSRRPIEPPWPDLVIGAGYGAVPVARTIRTLSRGAAKLVHIGNPRGRIDDFDLAMTTPQYARPAQPGLLELALPIGNPARRARPDVAEREWLRAFPHPRRLIAVGGPARYWELDHAALERTIRLLKARDQSGSMIVATSHRTRRRTGELLRRLVSGPRQAMVEDFPRFATLLAASDEIHVTADSVSMLSEAVLSGKPVGMIPIRRSLRGLLSLWLWERPRRRSCCPDLPNFWNLLRARRLVGTVELPVASQVCDTAGEAVRAVRALWAPGELFDERRQYRTDAGLGAARRPRRRQQPGDRAGRGARTAVRNSEARL
jgi:mitochondrial fission protein ELM1